MDHCPSRNELIEIVHRFYPAGIAIDHPAYSRSPQAVRLAAARRKAVEERSTWDAFLTRGRTSISHSRFADWSSSLELGADACYQARISGPGIAVEVPRLDEVVVLVSFIVPCYFIYTSISTRDPRGPGSRRCFPSWIRRTRAMYQSVESVVRETTGFSKLPPDLLFLGLPDIQVGNRGFGHARIADCIFTAHRF